MALRITLFNHLAALTSLFIAIILTLALLAWLNFDQDISLIFGIFYAIDALPSLYLHIEYYLKNRGEEYEIKHSEIIRYKHGEKQIFHKSELEKITVYMAPSVYQRSSLHFLAIESYHYARIITKGGEELIITCLLVPKVEEAVKQITGVVYERKKRLFNPL